MIYRSYLSVADSPEFPGSGEEATFRSEEKDLYIERKVVHRWRSRLTTVDREAAGWSGDSAAVPGNVRTTWARISCRLPPDWRLASLSRSSAAVLPRRRDPITRPTASPIDWPAIAWRATRASRALLGGPGSVLQAFVPDHLQGVID